MSGQRLCNDWQCAHYHPRSNLLSFDAEDSLKTHQTLGTSEAHQLLQLVKEAEADVQGYNAKTVWLRRRAMDLEVERKAFERRLTTAKSLLSPIRKLPREMVAEILLYCCVNNRILCQSTIVLGTGEPTVTESQVAIDIPAVVLGRVCKAWQIIIKSNPSMWATILLRIDHKPDPESSAKLATATQRMLELSQNYPLDVDMTIDEEGEVHPSALLLLAQCKRWGRAALHIKDATLLHSEHLQGLEGNLPTLEFLDIDGPVEIDQEVRLFATAPRLRSINWRRTRISYFVLPWQQISALDCWVVDHHELAHVIKAGKCLQQVVLEEFYISEENPWSSDYTLSSDTKKLDLTMKEQDIKYIEGLLSALSCPKLKYLALDIPDAKAKAGHLSRASLQGFLGTCTCLQDLRIFDVPLLSNDLLCILGMVPNLSRLHLEYQRRRHCISTNFCNSLVAYGQGGSHCVLPCLEHLDISLKFGSGVSFSHFADIVLSRGIPARSDNAVTCTVLVKAVIAICDTLLPRADHDQWKACTIDGMSVTLIDQNGFVDLD